MRKTVVYISGKYSGDIDNNIQAARHAAITLWEAGFTVICPHLNTYHLENDCKCSWGDYLEGDIELLKRSNVILMLDGWSESRGAKLEHEEALLLHIPVFYSTTSLLKHYLVEIFNKI